LHISEFLPAQKLALFAGITRAPSRPNWMSGPSKFDIEISLEELVREAGAELTGIGDAKGCGGREDHRSPQLGGVETPPSRRFDESRANKALRNI